MLKSSYLHWTLAPWVCCENKEEISILKSSCKVSTHKAVDAI